MSTWLEGEQLYLFECYLLEYENLGTEGHSAGHPSVIVREGERSLLLAEVRLCTAFLVMNVALR